MVENAHVKIRRFDPTVDKEPYYQTYEVPPIGWYNIKILDTLRYIYENLDPGLSFFDVCGQELCGGCIMMVNGKAVLACEAFSQSEMLLEPVPKFPLIKDLVVNLSMRI